MAPNMYRDHVEAQDALGTPDDPELRFYQVLLDETQYFELVNFQLPKPWPDRILKRGLVTPDVGHHLCSATKMAWVEHLDYNPAWDEYPGDAVREAWEDALSGEVDEDGGTYVEWHRLVRTYERDGGPEDITFREMAVDSRYQGTYRASDEEQAREDAHGDVLV